MERGVEASTIVDLPADRVRRLLQDDPGVALPNPTAIVVAAIHRDVVVIVDDVVGDDDDDRVVVPVSWHAAEQRKLFPTFLGALIADTSAAGTRLTMSGTYWVPLGLIGRFGDGVIGRRVAHDALRGVLTSAAERIEAALEGRDGSTEREIRMIELPPGTSVV